jgi:putative restriction endonuclease
MSASIAYDWTKEPDAEERASRPPDSVLVRLRPGEIGIAPHGEWRHVTACITGIRWWDVLAAGARGGVCMTPDELMERLSRLRRAQIGGKRAPHKPLLLLWLFGRFASTGSARASYADAAGPVSQLINDFGPPVRSPALERQRAAMPFVHLERDLWDLRDSRGGEIPLDVPETGRWLLDHDAVGQLRPEVTAVLADAVALAAAARLLLDQHFTPVLSEMICAIVGLDLPQLETPPARGQLGRRPRAAGFAEMVLRAYAYQCAMCGFDGRLGRNPVAIEAAHVRWHSQDGPDEVANAIALCSLHHALFDCGVLGLSPDLRITVSPLYVASSQSGRAIDALAGQPLMAMRPSQPAVDIIYVNWHTIQVFKSHSHKAA